MEQSVESNWYERWVFPIVDALADRDEHALDGAEQRVREAINDGEVDPDIARALEFVLGYHIYLRAVILNYQDRQPEAYAKAMKIMALPASGPVSSRNQRCLLLQIRIIADDIGTAVLERSEFNQLRSAIPESELHTEQWFYISKYTFKQRDIAETAKAYEQYLESSSNWARDYNWRRLEVMVKLLEQRATTLDIELLIKSMMVPGCATEMHNVIWPVAEEQGLTDDRLALLLKHRIRAIGSRDAQS